MGNLPIYILNNETIKTFKIVHIQKVVQDGV